MSDELKGSFNDGSVWYDDEGIVAKFLASNDLFISGQSQGLNITLCVNCNDIFWWACADAESISWPEDIHSLYEEYLKGEKWFAARWCSFKRKLRPQWCAVQLMMKAGEWTPEMEALPDREDNGSLGNPIIESYRFEGVR